MKVQTLYALTSHSLTIKAPFSKSCMFLLFAVNFGASLTNSVDEVWCLNFDAVYSTVLPMWTKGVYFSSGRTVNFGGKKKHFSYSCVWLGFKIA